jgi:putative ABC transport system substrate-binding protein
MSYREGDAEGEGRLSAFRSGLREAGWVEGRNVSLEVRWLAGDRSRATAYATDIVALSPDVILVNGTQGLSAVRPLTTTIPIVFVVVTNPVGAGFVESLARPGGNITGFSTFEPEIGGKWLESLKALAPEVVRVGVLHDSEALGFKALWLTTESVAPTFGIQAVPIHAAALPRSNAVSRVSRRAEQAGSSFFRPRSTPCSVRPSSRSLNDIGCQPCTLSASTHGTGGSWRRI